MANLYFIFYRNILAKDSDVLNRTRMRILLACILIFMALTAILSVTYLFGPKGILLYRILFFFCLFSLCLYLFFSHLLWRHAAHFFLCTVLLLIWSNVLLVNQSLHVINVQYCLVIIAAGYYVLGSRDGLRYAAVAIFPLLADVLLSDFLGVLLPTKQVNLNYTAFGIAVFVNFFLLIYIHHLFFNSLYKASRMESSINQRLKLAVADSQEQSQTKTNFLTTMSHEIRTPLNAIVGMSNLLLSGTVLDEQKENLRVLDFSAQNLMSTVNNILDFSSLDSAELLLHHKPFSVLKTITSVCATFNQVAAEKGLRFDCEIDPVLEKVMVLGDELRLSQILFHLVGNAINFTKEGFISVQVKHQGVSGQQIHIGFKIIDSGIGIPEALQRYIKDPFSKKMPRNQRQFQTSLGLTIASKLLKLHDSTMTVTSAESYGSTFEFLISYLLVEEKDNNSEPLSPISEGDLSGLQVLCVDDEKLNLMVVRKILQKWNVTAQEASNGQHAVDLCQSNRYDVVLMDINMPVMDGFEASKIIKSLTTGWPAPLIIALTASVGSAKEEVLSFSSIDDCILKPFKPEELKEKLEQFSLYGATGLLPDAG